MVSRTSECRSAFWAIAVPALRTTAVPNEWRVPWKVTWRGTGFTQVVGFPQRASSGCSSPASCHES